jgi:hypothetical protein
MSDKIEDGLKEAIKAYYPAGKIEDGGPAFPVPTCSQMQGGAIHWSWGGGMSLRDYLAAHETLSDFDHPEEQMPHTGCVALAGPQPDAKDGWEAQFIWNAKWRAKLRYLRADAMIEAGRVK